MVEATVSFGLIKVIEIKVRVNFLELFDKDFSNNILL